MVDNVHERRLPAERRKHPRLGFDCPLRWNAGGVDRAGWTLDISDGGVGFTARSICAPCRGERVQIALELDGDYEWLVDTAAHVVRSEPLGDGLHSVGVQVSQRFDL